MTIQVNIKHMQPIYDKKIIINQLSKGQLDLNYPPAILEPGQEITFYVYGDRSIEVGEYGGP